MSSARKQATFATTIGVVDLIIHDHVSLPAVAPSVASLHGVDRELRLSTDEQLSLIAQYAAHIAFSRFAGRCDVRFESTDWLIARRRGEDPLLLRVAGWTSLASDVSDLTLIEAFRESIASSVSLPSFDVSWSRADAVFVDVVKSLGPRSDASPNLRRAAMGRICAPGVEQLRSTLLLNGGGRVRSERHVARTLAALRSSLSTRVLDLDEQPASPLVRYSLFSQLSAEWNADADPARVAELLTRDGRLIAVSTKSLDRADRWSREVIDHLLDVPSRFALLTADGASPDGRTFAISDSTATRRAFCVRLARESSFVEARELLTRDGNAMRRFVATSALPLDAESRLPKLEEPRRSFVAAIALAGVPLPVAVVHRFLATIGCSLPHDALFAGVVSMTDERLLLDAELRLEAERLLEPEHRSALLTLLVESCREEKALDVAASLLIEHARFDLALPLLHDLSTALQSELVARIPDDELRGPWLTQRIDEKLASGKYLDALQLLRNEDESAHGRWQRAFALRRIGRYGEAAALLEESDGVESLLLRAELLRLQGDLTRAQSLLKTIAIDDDALVDRVNFERAMLAIDEGSAVGSFAFTAPYFADRLEAYAALERGEFAVALDAARRAAVVAPSSADRIDAELDVAFALFSSGEWDEARLQYRRILQWCEETQGDRVAAGALFTLAYLCADEDDLDEAREKTERLRRFYAHMGDEQRTTELLLLEAYVELNRGALASARAAASRALEHVRGEIAEACRLILDEVAWMEGTDEPLRSLGNSRCVELRDRALLLRSWRGEKTASAIGAANRELRSLRSAMSMQPSGRALRRKRFRALSGFARRSEDARLQRMVREEAEALQIELASEQIRDAVPNSELRLLQTLSTASFPFAFDTFERPWFYASRNRLGRWFRHGNHPLPAGDGELEALLVTEHPDKLQIAEGALLFVEGAGRWSEATRVAVTSMVALRSTHEQQRRLLEEQEETPDAPAVLDGVLGTSAALRELASRVERIAESHVAVTVIGETGTGKELIARAIHRASTRRSRPFTAVNCGALPDHLIESELFGHVRGAFTSADRDRAGLIEATDGGTIFLDEVGELPLLAQAKLLRFLQEGEIRRVGDTVTRKADVRVVAATNRELADLVDERRFREDLYYRIVQLELRIPPLRDRAGDALMLARHFVSAEQKKRGRGPDRFSDTVEAIIASYAWPGNVRQLQNTVRAAQALAGDARFIDVQHLPERIANTAIVKRAGGTYHDEVMRFRRSLIERSLEQSNGNQNQAAKALGMSRQALAYQIRELGIVVK